MFPVYLFRKLLCVINNTLIAVNLGGTIAIEAQLNFVSPTARLVWKDVDGLSVPFGSQQVSILYAFAILLSQAFDLKLSLSD